MQKIYNYMKGIILKMIKNIKKKTKAKSIKLPITPLIMLTIIAVAIVVDLSIAKYKSATNAIDSVQVAIMANDAYIEFDDEIKGYPGCDPKIYEINVTNKENEKICEVKQKYKFKIEREESKNLPIEIALYKDSGCTQILNTNEDGYYEDETFLLEEGIEQTNKVYLKIIWPETKKNASYAFEIDYFALHIISTQID